MRIVEVDPGKERPGVCRGQPLQRGIDNRISPALRLELLSPGLIALHVIVVQVETVRQPEAPIEHVRADKAPVR